MPGYSTRSIEVAVSGHGYRLRLLATLQQFVDLDGRAERFGISSVQWPAA